MTENLKSWPYPLWVAHRGAGKLAPENTMAAFRLGAVHGYRMFECDAKLSADGVLFLMHDATLERTTNGHGTGGDLSMGEIAQLDAGSWHSRAFAGESLPTLEALARWCLANHFFLNVEIKPTPGQEEATGRATGELMNRIWPRDRIQPLFTLVQDRCAQGRTRHGTAHSAGPAGGQAGRCHGRRRPAHRAGPGLRGHGAQPCAVGCRTGRQGAWRGPALQQLYGQR